ncbi:unnamed protein product [Moneuplotes crassus]|uniref:Uncharacterized protein n=1 Tax=Euplotes crassus TaxID=5936 RepID=A0AAD1XJN3_EUPCR|nr:unnamed protein product [Moneuplotes crassus]
MTQPNKKTSENLQIFQCNFSKDHNCDCLLHREAKVQVKNPSRGRRRLFLEFLCRNDKITVKKLEREKQIIARNIYKNNDTTIFNRKLLLNLGLEKQSCVRKQGIREKTCRKLQFSRKRGISSGAKVSFIKSVRDRKSTVDQTDFMMKRAVRGVDIPEKKTASKISLKYLKNFKYGKSPKRTFRLIKLGCKKLNKSLQSISKEYSTCKSSLTTLAKNLKQFHFKRPESPLKELLDTTSKYGAYT